MKLDYHMGFKEARATCPACGHRRKKKAVWGIVASAAGSSASVSNCYNVGHIDGSASAFVGAVIGHMNNANGTTSNLYYLDGSCSKGIGVSAASTQTAVSKLEAAMTRLTFLNNLNSGLEFAAFAAGSVYPILDWQNS